jgi:predicted phage baseplate assembly protein
MPATGGTAPEPMAEAKLNAPHAWRFGPLALMRAITPEDYAAIAGRNPMLQRAAARFAWSGSWHEVEVALDPRAAFTHRGAALVAEAAAALEPFRRIGHELDPQLAIPVPIDLELEICIKPDYQRGQVRQALLHAFGNRALPGGGSGLFHPDRLSFGQPIYLSQLIAAAHNVPGVAHATITRLERQFEGPAGEIAAGKLALGPFEVAQLDNDPNYPDRGVLTIAMKGGR